MSIVAHRGDFLIENTLIGFENSWKNNIMIVECDIRLTKDKVIVISHDNKIKIDKLEIEIDKTDWINIKDIVLQNGHKIPTLEELFKLTENIANSERTINFLPKIIIEMKTNRKDIGIYLANFLNENKQYVKYIELIMSFSVCSLHSFNKYYNNCSKLLIFLILNDMSKHLLKIINSDYSNNIPFSTIIEKKYKLIDGYYIKYNPLMLENKLINNKLLNIISLYKIGIWGTDKTIINSDNIEIINKLLEIGIKYVNTNDINIIKN